MLRMLRGDEIAPHPRRRPRAGAADGRAASDDRPRCRHRRGNRRPRALGRAHLTLERQLEFQASPIWRRRAGRASITSPAPPQRDPPPYPSRNRDNPLLPARRYDLSRAHSCECTMIPHLTSRRSCSPCRRRTDPTAGLLLDERRSARRSTDGQARPPPDRSETLRCSFAISAGPPPCISASRKSDRCVATRLTEPSASTSTTRQPAVVCRTTKPSVVFPIVLSTTVCVPRSRVPVTRNWPSGLSKFATKLATV